MVMKDYYIILGLPKGVDKSRIKKAYRDIAKRLHPDVSDSSKNRRQFMEAKEAYETLTDDAAREKYDRELERLKTGVKINTPLSRRQYNAPRTSPGTRWGRGSRPSSPPYGKRPRYHRDYWLEMDLAPGQARSGGDFTVSLPYIQPCPHCRQAGILDRFFCPACSGRGIASTPRDYIVTLPADLAQGDTFRQLAYDNGFVALYLNVVIRLKTTPRPPRP